MKNDTIQNLTIDDIPSNLRLAYKRAYKGYPEASISPGLIQLLQNYGCDPADEDRWNRINAFLEEDLDAEDQAVAPQ